MRECAYHKGGINKTKTGKKQFAAGQLLSNRPLHTPGNEVQELAFWKVFPESKALRNAKLFLLGQISLILTEGRPSNNAENNPSTEVIVQTYNYNPAANAYCENGRMAPHQCYNVMYIIDVTKHIQYNKFLTR